MSINLPPVALYKSSGNPSQSALNHRNQTIAKHNDMVNKYGGKRKYTGGDSSPESIVVPQAPNNGMVEAGPNSAASSNLKLAHHLVNAQAQAQYDSVASKSLVEAQNQNGGGLLKKLRKILKTKKKRKGKKRGKTQRKKHKSMKKK